MISLSIVDDIGAILVVAIGYSSHIVWGALAVAALGIAVVRALATVGVWGRASSSSEIRAPGTN